MSQIVEAMSVFLEVVKNHSFYEEQGFPHDANFERFALEGFREKGRGFLSIDLSDFVQGYIKGKAPRVVLRHKYIPLDEIFQTLCHEEAIRENEALLSAINRYNPETHYVVQLTVEATKIPETVPWEYPNNFLRLGSVVPLTTLPKSAHLVPNQIKKRLRRMIHQGQTSLIADTSKPDFMGENLAKWTKAVEELQQEGKHITLIVFEESDRPS